MKERGRGGNRGGEEEVTRKKDEEKVWEKDRKNIRDT